MVVAAEDLVEITGGIQALPHDVFYSRLTARNRGLVDEIEQQRLRRTAILVAGCGSIGGAVVEPLVRLGAEHLMLAEPDGYELHNLNRQNAGLADVGRNKARVLADRIHQINPHADVEVDVRGITADNVATLVAAAGLIFDGVDVTTSSALAGKYALHVAAQRFGVPVVCGYDIAGSQLVLVYDYRSRSLPVLRGRLEGQSVEQLDPLRFLARVVPLRAVPVEMFGELRRQLSGQSTAFPQLVYSAHLFGVLACRVALDLLAGRPVRHRIAVDVHTLTRTGWQRWRSRVSRLAELVRISRIALAYRR
jgi:predicted ThiF/HesA family dinucleotide-utilizing enzyme